MKFFSIINTINCHAVTLIKIFIFAGHSKIQSLCTGKENDFVSKNVYELD